ncbi:MAG: hydrogenase maturation nickel metallochaperone HypA [Candidatus Sumerlaeaceae bacterium]|nr:hydrogenase maturation nickel metallochaperone HypA [Candidatus Sumerlaeaceae bacterium]
MHEYAIVQSLVENTLKSLAVQEVVSVEAIRFRRGSAFSEEALRQAFAAASAGTVLKNATLDIETVNLDHQCPCGHQQVINSDDLIGHMYVCPKCGTMREIEEAHDVELIEIVGATVSHKVYPPAGGKKPQTARKK